MVLADVRTTVATYRYDPFSLWVMKSAGDGFTLLGRVVGRQVALRFLNRPRCFQAPLVEDASLAGSRDDARGRIEPRSLAQPQALLLVRQLIVTRQIIPGAPAHHARGPLHLFQAPAHLRRKPPLVLLM